MFWHYETKLGDIEDYRDKELKLYALANPFFLTKGRIPNWNIKRVGERWTHYSQGISAGPPKVEYYMSEMGKGLRPVVRAIYEWIECSYRYI